MMLSKVIIVWMVAVVCLLGGCAGKSEEPAGPPPEQTKTAAEYKAEADKEITEENMSAELDQLEQNIEQEADQPVQ